MLSNKIVKPKIKKNEHTKFPKRLSYNEISKDNIPQKQIFQKDKLQENTLTCKTDATLKINEQRISQNALINETNSILDELLQSSVEVEDITSSEEGSAPSSNIDKNGLISRTYAIYDLEKSLLNEPINKYDNKLESPIDELFNQDNSSVFNNQSTKLSKDKTNQNTLSSSSGIPSSELSRISTPNDTSAGARQPNYIDGFDYIKPEFYQNNEKLLEAKTASSDEWKEIQGFVKSSLEIQECLSYSKEESEKILNDYIEFGKYVDGGISPR